MDGIFELEINGKKTALKFTMWMIERMDELNRTKPAVSITFAKTALIYAGIQTYCRSNKTENPFTIEEIDIWADDLTASDEGNELLTRIEQAFTNSAVLRKLMNDEEEAKKKRLNGAMSTPSPLVS